MHKEVLIIGAGGMARAIAWDLRKQEPHHRVRVLERDEAALQALEVFIGTGEITPILGDASDPTILRLAMQGVNVVISAASYTLNLVASRLAIEYGAHWVDLGGNPFVVRDQFALNAEAKAGNVAMFPDCGLAPGLINIIAAQLVSELDEVEEIHLRVGGLPQVPKPPLFYGLVFSPEGLANEYQEPAIVIENGELREVESLTGWERVYFGSPLGTLEAFHTSGGASTLVDTYLGKVKTLDYKTLRYPGHLRKIKLLKDLGLWEARPVEVTLGGSGAGTTAVPPRKVLGELLKRLGWVTEDLVVVVAWAVGKKNGQPCRVEAKMLDYFDPATGLTAMARTTGFPAMLIARMLAEGKINARGVLRQEEEIPRNELFDQLRRRGVKIEFGDDMAVSGR